MINRTMSLRAWSMLVVLSVLWGGSFFFVEVAITGLPPLAIVFLRVALSALVLWAVVLVSGCVVPRDAAVWRAFMVMGCLNNAIPFTLIVWGQAHIDSGLASILNATTPLFTVIVAGMLLVDERITARKVFGVLVGFLGVVVMIGPAAFSDIGASPVAQGAVIMAAFSYALAGVYGRRFRELGVDPMVTAAGQVTASSFLLAPFALTMKWPLQQAFPAVEVWLAVVALAVLSTALAYVLYFRILASVGATRLLIVTFLIPVTAILLGVLVLDETLARVHVLGMVLVGAGLTAIGSGRKKDREIDAASSSGSPSVRGESATTTSKPADLPNN